MTQSSGVAIIGGGRWARTIGDLLVKIVAKKTSITVVSPTNAANWINWVKDRPSFQVEENLNSVLKNSEITHVIIARRAVDHAETCLSALKHGKSVLVEKPFCLTAEEANKLAIVSKNANVGTGLVFHFGTNHSIFRNACMASGGIQFIKLEWSDPACENRHGYSKTYDESLNVVQDVLPHAWSIFRPYTGRVPLELKGVNIDSGGRVVYLKLIAGTIFISLKFERNAKNRCRKLLVGGIGWEGNFDFASEPGQASINGEPIDVSYKFESPLALELQAFLRNELPPLVKLDIAQEAIKLSISAVTKLRRLQAQAIKKGRKSGASPNDQSAAHYAFREIVAGGISGNGRGSKPEDILTWIEDFK